MPQYIPLEEHERVIRELMARSRDDEVERMADRDGERLAVLETELRHVRQAQQEAAKIAKEERAVMQAELVELAKKVQALTDVLTKLSGVKIAFTVVGATIAVAVTQFWNFISWR